MVGYLGLMSEEPIRATSTLEHSTSEPTKHDDEVDESVYKRSQLDKWNRSRKNDRDRSAKRAKKNQGKKRQGDTNTLDENGNPLPKSERRPKRKVACMIGYSGTGYNGMQIQSNPSIKTIEGDLFEAFVKAGAISPENATDIKKNGFMRAARTDKGVHAAGNVISCKLIIEDPDIVSKINENLPNQIRVWGIERTNKSFDCRKNCSSRVYEYLIPTYSFLPPKPKSAMSELVKNSKIRHPDTMRKDVEGDNWWKDTYNSILEEGITEDDLAKAQSILENSQAEKSEEDRESAKQYDENGVITENGMLIREIKKKENKKRRAYKLSSERLNLFREAMKQYEGTHNFHNFTLGKEFKDPSAIRYMKGTEVSDPFVIEGTEWISIKIHGQSFMLHQIRKMVAMATLVVRTGCPLSRIHTCFGKTKVNIPKAPALGLLLENPVYEGYNRALEKFGYNKIDFDNYSKDMDDFKMKYIYDKIYAEEVKSNVFYSFFGFIDTFKGTSESSEGKNIFHYLGAEMDAEQTCENEDPPVKPTQPQENVD